MTPTSTTESRLRGDLIASNPTGPRHIHVRALGNSQRGFQVWLSRDGMNWIPAGECHTSYEEMAAAFAETYPRPTEIHDAAIAAAYDSR